MNKHNIYPRKYFYPATNEFTCYEYLKQFNSTPKAHSFSNNILCLPLYADMEINDVEKICNIIKNK